MSLYRKEIKKLKVSYSFFHLPTLIPLLTTIRDLQKSIGTRSNDVFDIFSLAVAIPYCDIVVTENFWSNEATRENLGDEYNTKILKNINHIIELINN